MIAGAVCLLSGLHLLFSRPELRSLLGRMLSLLILLLFVLSIGVFWLADYLGEGWLPQDDTWYRSLLSCLLWGASLALSILAAVVAYPTLGAAVAAPWLDRLAAAVESPTNAATHEISFARAMAHSLGNSIRPLFELLKTGVLALILFLIPWIGPVAATLLWIGAGIRYLNYELMDAVASRRGWNFQQRRRELKRRPFFFFGFGGLAMLMLFVPILNLVVLPAATVALSRRGLGEP